MPHSEGGAAVPVPASQTSQIHVGHAAPGLLSTAELGVSSFWAPKVQKSRGKVGPELLQLFSFPTGDRRGKSHRFLH